jgi:hypothetical protein
MDKHPVAGDKATPSLAAMTLTVIRSLLTSSEATRPPVIATSDHQNTVVTGTV